MLTIYTCLLFVEHYYSVNSTGQHTPADRFLRDRTYMEKQEERLKHLRRSIRSSNKLESFRCSTKVYRSF